MFFIPLLDTILNYSTYLFSFGVHVHVPSFVDLWIFLKDYMDQVKAKFITNGKIKEDELMKYLTQLIREYYQIYWNFPKLAEVHRRVPAYMMWDDHEVRIK